MKEYRLQEEADAQRLEEEADQILSAAQRENQISDNYVLVTVPFAIISLFCGLSTKFWVPGIRTAIVTMAFVVFVGAVFALFFMPVS
jgi:glucan phosphoethanolaminetransferase (alkaline phosphatase superfamily)